MKLYVVCNGKHEYAGLYDDLAKAEAEAIKGDGYYYEFDLSERHYWENGALMDVDSL